MEEKYAPGAVITSRNRKVQLEFNEDTRAQTAGKAISSDAPKQRSGTTSMVNRPSTIEGIAPAPPMGEKVSRSYRTLSPREISLIAQPTGSNPHIIDKSQELTSSRRPMSVQVSRGKKTTEGIAAHNENNKVGSRPASSWQRVDVDPMMPSFLKRHRLAGHNNSNSVTNNGEDSFQGNTNNATHNYNNSSFHQNSYTVDPPVPAEEDLHRKNMLINRLKVAQQPLGVSSSSSAPTIMNHFLSCQVKSDFFRKQISAKTHLGKLMKFDSSNLRRLPYTEKSAASTEFQHMELDDVIRYLWEMSNSKSGYGSIPGTSSSSNYVEFVHVTQRSNIEKVQRESFYDLVALERPGHPNSGYIWTRDIGKYAFNNHVLPKHKIMQLSLNGLLITHELDEQPEIIPLEEFFLERDQLEFLRTGNFFGYFKELKAFSAWKSFTHHSYVQRMKKLLLKNTFFAEPELVAVNLLVIRSIYEMETETDLFSFVGKGLIYAEQFLSKQMEYVDEVRRSLHQKIQTLGDSIAQTYTAYMDSAKLEEIIKEVKEHHPLRDVIEETEDKVDWIKLRSVQRLGDSYKEKVKGILYAAQYRLEYALANIVEKFWLRMKQSVIGIHHVKGERKTGNMNAWCLKTGMFDHTGKIIPDVAYAENIALESYDAFENLEDSFLYSKDESILGVHNKYNHQKSSENKEGKNKDNTKNTTAEDKEENRMRKLGNSNQKKVSSEWEKEGCHISLLVNLFVGDRVLEMQDLIALRSPENIRVQITPTKQGLMNQVHMVCGQIGRMFETLPNLKHHSLLVEQVYKTSYLDKEIDLGLGEMENVHSSVYFTFLVLFPSYNSRFAYSLAIETMKMFLHAYQEACAIEFYTFKLGEIFRKLWSLSPTALIKQMDRSFSLAKIKDFVDQPDMIEDLRRTQLRDKNRLVIFLNAVSYLNKLPHSLKYFSNIKHRHGLITSFYPVIDQLKKYRMIQDFYLYIRLPNAYSTRCSLFYDYVRKLETIFDTEGKLLQDDVKLMQRIQNFEMSKEFFDAELEICHHMFQTYLAHVDRQLSSEETMLAVMVEQLLAGSKGRTHAQALTPEKLNAVVLEALERLIASLSRCRSTLLAKLPDIRNEVMISRQGLRSKIAEQKAHFEGFDITDTERAAEEINMVMSFTGKEMDLLHKQVEESVNAQFVLVEAHDIVGAANPIMVTNEIDRLDDMHRLETLYKNRCAAWRIIMDTESIVRQTIASKLANVGIAELNAKFVKLVESWEKLSGHIDDIRIVKFIDTLLRETKPKVELVSYFSTKTLRPRHWIWMGKHIFRPCHFDIKLSGRQLEFVTIVDIKGKDPVGLGNINRLAASDVINRGMERHLGKMRLVIANAVIESFLESTLDAVEEALQSAIIFFSGLWLRDRRMREKMAMEIGEVMNLVPLRVLSRYCWKAVTMVETTSMDLCLLTFENRIDRLKESVLKIDRFFDNFREAQFMWYYLLHFVKFTARGEMDRDSIRMYNSCTEDIKKMEMILSQKSGNILAAFQNAVEYDLNAEGLKNFLNIIMEDAHSAIQSLLDACPRLSLLSYNRLVGLFKSWLMGAHNDVEFVSSCMRELFEGVGVLKTTMSTAQKIMVCTGFVSDNSIETVTFYQPIPFELPLDDFVKQFEEQLRKVMEKSCDVLVLHRINCMKALLSDQAPETVLQNIHAMHSIRHGQLRAMINNDYLTSAYMLTNACSFAEDLWTSLGHPSGCITVARPALLLESLLFSQRWRVSLENMRRVIEENIQSMQEWFLHPIAFPRTGFVKSVTIMSNLLGQEIAFLQQLEEIYGCDCLESATELWTGKFQIRFEFEQTKRYRNCPFEISVGNISVPYGMEYQETGSVTMYRPEMEYAIGRVLSSAFSFRGTTFVNSTGKMTPIDTNGEFQVSGKDIALALGRPCCTLSDASYAQNIRFFFARLIYLDAVGCVEFSTIDQASLEVFIQTAQSFWSAIENKSDQYIQDSLKFPMRTKFTRNELQSERRKNNLTQLRSTINMRKKDNTHLGILFIGFASESEYTSLSVFDHFYRSIFDSVTMEMARAIDRIGLLLSYRGFIYGAELQSTLIVTLQHQMKRADFDPRISLEAFKRINNFMEIKRLAEVASEVLRIVPFSRFGVNYHSKVDRFALESICFCAALWDRLVVLSSGSGMLQDQEEFFKEFITKLDVLATTSQTSILSEMTKANTPFIYQHINLTLLMAAQEKGLMCNHSFIQNCALLWDTLSKNASPVVVVTGDRSSGKTSIIQTVVSTIDRIGLKKDIFGPQSWPIACRIAGKRIVKFVKAYHDYLAERKKELEQQMVEDVTAAMEKEKQLQRAQVMGHLESIAGGAGASQEYSESPHAGSSSDMLSNFSKVEKKGVAEDQNSSVFVANYEPKSARKSDVAIFYHGSLSLQHLIGSFDHTGKWLDGALVRKLRYWNDRTISQKLYLSNAMNLMVLVGPMNANIEQLLHAILCQSLRNVFVTHETLFPQFSFPTGETFPVSDQTKIIIESVDLRELSPSCLSLIPMQRIQVPVVAAIQRIVNVWLRSLIHWLGDFLPWLDFLEDIERLLLHTKFLEEMLYEDFNVSNPSVAIILSKLTSFLRLLEELLLEVHNLALAQATFTIPEDRSDSSDSDTEDSDIAAKVRLMQLSAGESFAVVEDKYKGVMVLHPRMRELLNLRAKLSVVYAATWGLGGYANSTEKRKFFDSMLRDTIQHFYDVELPIDNDCSIFDCVFLMEEAKIVQALQFDPRTKEKILNDYVPEKYTDHNLYCEFFSRPNNNSNDSLIFRTIGNRSVSEALRVLLSAGANVFVFGAKNCGKTQMIQEILEDLKRNCPTPEQMRRQIYQHLVSIVNQAKKADGIFRSLELVQAILKQVSRCEVDVELHDDFNLYWKRLSSEIKHAAESPRCHCQAKTVSSSTTSFRGNVGAHSIRAWLEREFASETPYVLETARFTYGLAFIDDVHYLAEDENDGSWVGHNGRHDRLNRPEELLRGILDGFPTFSIQRNVSVRSDASLGFHKGSMDGSFLRATETPPILHREENTDLRMCLARPDNYMMQRMGLVCAGTGHASDIFKSTMIQSITNKFSTISMPSFTAMDLHVSLITGALVSMAVGAKDFSVISLLQSEIIELTRVTMITCSRMVSNNDYVLTTPLERVMRSSITMDIDLVARFCLALKNGSHNIHNPGGLLQLYAHEWKRVLLDPLPDGAQRDRIVSLISEQIDQLDEKHWSVNRDWLQTLKEDLGSKTDRVWANVDIFANPEVAKLHARMHSRTRSSSGNNMDDEGDAAKFKDMPPLEYLPLELEISGMNAFIRNGAFNASLMEFEPVLTAATLLPSEQSFHRKLNFGTDMTSSQIQSLLYPAAISMVLRIVRVLTNKEKSVLLAGYPGSSATLAIRLAAKLCHAEVKLFSVKEGSGVMETSTSERAQGVFSFKAFVKSMILRAAGLSDPITSSDDVEYQQQVFPNTLILPGQYYYTVQDAEKILVVINDAQHLCDEDRRALLFLMDIRDPTCLFEDAEIQGMAETWRKNIRENDFKKYSTDDTKEDSTNHVRSSYLSRANASVSAVTVTSSYLPQSSQGISSDIQQAIHAAQSLDENSSILHKQQMQLQQEQLLHQQELENNEISKPSVAGTQGKGDLNGYVFQWIRTKLVKSMKENLSFAFTLTLSRSMELDPAFHLTSQESLTLLKKVTGQQKVKTKHSRKHSIAVQATQQQQNLSQSVVKRSLSQRYSMLSNRGSEVSHSSSGMLYNPFRQKGALQGSANDSFGGSSAAGGNGSTSGGSGGGPDVGVNKSHIISSHSLFTCPILGPILVRSLTWIWYNVDGVDATRGVCNLLMRNDKFFDKHWKPKPIMLSLKSTDIGNYYLSDQNSHDEQASQQRGGNKQTAGTNVPATNTASSKKPASSDQIVEDKRRLKFKSGSSLHIFNLLLRGEVQINLMHDLMNLVSEFGVFKQYTYLGHFTYELPEVDNQIISYIEEARSLLPHLLTVPLPTDVILLQDAVYSIGAESVARQSAEDIMYIMRKQGLPLLRSRYSMQNIQEALEDALYALNNTDYMDQQIVENNAELEKATRKVSADIEMVQKELTLVDKNFERNITYEQEVFLREDQASHLLRMKTFESTIEEALNEHRQAIAAYALGDWQMFGSRFLSKPFPKPFVEIMRALMVVINFTPKLSKGEKANSSVSKMDDDMVAKYTNQLLMKYVDFSNTLSTLNPLNLSATQVHALRIMNSLLNSSYAEYLSTEIYNSAQRFDFYRQYLSLPISEVPVFDTLRCFLLILELSISSLDHVQNKYKPSIDAMDVGIHHMWRLNEKEREIIALEWRKKRDSFMEYLLVLDTTLENNNKKLATIEKNRISQSELIQSITQASIYLHKELECMQKILKSFVIDACIAVVILHRVGWFPDHVRQECADILRKNLISYNIRCTETPFLAGNLLDRWQIRKWCSYDEASGLPKDIPSINSMSLLYMSPHHVLVIDPDACASATIAQAAPENYEVFTVPGQKFTLQMFDNWVSSIVDTVNVTADKSENLATNASSKTTNERGMFVVINDIQSGASDDLLCFLGSKIVYPPNSENNDDDELSMRVPVDVMNSAAATISPRLSILQVNKRANFTSNLVPENEQANYYLFNIDAAGALDPKHPLYAKNSYLRVPKRLKIVLISSKPPVLTSTGTSFPLPLSCMENMSVIYWSISINQSFYVDPKPIQNALEKSMASDHTIEEKLATRLIRFLSHGHMDRLVNRNFTLIEHTRELANLEAGIHHAVFRWMQEENAKLNQNVNIDGLIDQQTVSLSVLSSDEVVDCLLKSNGVRENYQSSLDAETSLLREHVAYLSCFSGVFGMTADFTRLCAKFLPSEAFVPYCFSIPSMITNFLPGAMKQLMNERHIIQVPSSLYRAYKVWTAVVSIQRQYRSWKQNERENNGVYDPSKMKAPRFMVISSAMVTPTNAVNADTSLNQTLNKAVNEEGIRVSGFLPSARAKAVLVMNYKLLPMRSYFLREMVRYVQQNIRPGMEDIVKWLMLVSSWAQSEEVPSHEIRSLFYFFLENEQYQARRFCYFYPLRHVSDDKILATLQSARPRTASYDESVTSGGGDSARPTSASRRRLPSRENSMGNRSRTTSSDSTDGGRISPSTKVMELDISEFVEELPNTAMISDRVTAFRSNHNNNDGARNEYSQGKAKNSVVIIESKRRKATRKLTTQERRTFLKYEEILDVGPGVPDCLWVNKRSSKWAVMPARAESDAQYRNQHFIQQAFDTGMYVFNDDSLIIQEKNKLLLLRQVAMGVGSGYYAHGMANDNGHSSLIAGNVMASLSGGDLFEVEWLKIKGIRAFATMNQQVLSGLGATTKTMEDVNASRQSIMVGGGGNNVHGSSVQRERNSSILWMKTPTGFGFKREGGFAMGGDSNGVNKGRKFIRNTMRLSGRQSRFVGLRKVSTESLSASPKNSSNSQPLSPTRVSIRGRQHILHSFHNHNPSHPLSSPPPPPQGQKSTARTSAPFSEISSLPRRASSRASAMLEELNAPAISDAITQPHSADAKSAVEVRHILLARRISARTTKLARANGGSFHQRRISSTMRIRDTTNSAGTSFVQKQQSTKPSSNSMLSGIAQAASNFRLRQQQEREEDNTHSHPDHASTASDTAAQNARKSTVFNSTSSSIAVAGDGDFTELIDDDRAYMSMLMLETHPMLARVFRGVTQGIAKNYSDFADWKDNIMSLAGGMDARKLSDAELWQLIQLIQPPRCLVEDPQKVLAIASGRNTAGGASANNAADGHAHHAHEDGLWAKGYELTVVQSLLLTEALWPGTMSLMMHAVYVVVANYLMKEGHIMLHPDEVFAEEEEEEDDDNIDEEEEEEDEEDREKTEEQLQEEDHKRKLEHDTTTIAEEDENEENIPRKVLEESQPDEENEETRDAFPTSSSTKLLHRPHPPAIQKPSSLNSITTSFGGRLNLKPSDSSPATISNRSTFMRSLKSYNEDLRELMQENVHTINGWTHLESFLSGAKKVPPLILADDFYPPEQQRHAITQRDFSCWETVLCDVLMDYTDIDKFVFMKELRDTMLGQQTTYFLVPSRFGCQGAIFSQRARDFALQAGKHIPILFCQTANAAANHSSLAISVSNNSGGGSAVMLSNGMDGLEKKLLRHNLLDLMRLMRASLTSTTSNRKAICEMVDMHSTEGNALLYSVLSNSVFLSPTNSNISGGQNSQTTSTAAGSSAAGSGVPGGGASSTSGASGSASSTSGGGSNLSWSVTEGKVSRYHRNFLVGALILGHGAATTTSSSPSGGASTVTNSSTTKKGGTSSPTKAIATPAKIAQLQHLLVSPAQQLATFSSPSKPFGGSAQLFPGSSTPTHSNANGYHSGASATMQQIYASWQPLLHQWRDHFPLIASSHWILPKSQHLLPSYLASINTNATNAGGEEADANGGSGGSSGWLLQSQQQLITPPTALAELSFAWLPRYFAPDVVRLLQSTDGKASEPFTSSAVKFLLMQDVPSLPESCGILYEEMESTVIWIMICSRSISQTRITPEIRSQLQQTNKIQIRVTACLLALWQVMLYVRCQENEARNLSTNWSGCLNALNLWQLSRLLLKTKDFLQNDWVSVMASLKNNDKNPEDNAHLVKNLMQTPVFQKGLKLLCESLSRIDCNFYHSEHYFSAHAASTSTTSSAQKSSPSKSTAPTVSSATGVGNRNAIVTTSGIAIVNNLRQEIDKWQQSVYLFEEKLKKNKKSNQSGDTPSFPHRSSEGTSAGQSVRAQKQYKKALRKLDEAKFTFVQELSHLEHFSYLSNRRMLTMTMSPVLSVNATNANSANAAQVQFMARVYRSLGRYLADVVITLYRAEMATMTQQQQQSDKIGVRKSFFNRNTHTTISAQQQQQQQDLKLQLTQTPNRPGPPPVSSVLKLNSDKKTSAAGGKDDLTMSKAALFAVSARRASQRMNISSLFSNTASPLLLSTDSATKEGATSILSSEMYHPPTTDVSQEDEESARQERELREIHEGLDVLFGSLQPLDVVRCMLQWTFDGSSVSQYRRIIAANIDTNQPKNAANVNIKNDNNNSNSSSPVKEATGLNRQKILAGIRRMSTAMGKGDVNLPSQG